MRQIRIGLIYKTKISLLEKTLSALDVLVQLVSLDIFYHFVYNLGIAYSATATYFTYSDEGLIMIDITTSADKKLKVVDDAKKILVNLKTDSESLSKIRDMLIGQYTINLEDVREKTRFVSSRYIETGRVISIKKWLCLLEKVSNKEVTDLKKRIFGKKPLVVTLSIH